MGGIEAAVSPLFAVLFSATVALRLPAASSSVNGVSPECCQVTFAVPALGVNGAVAAGPRPSIDAGALPLAAAGAAA